VTDSKGKKKNLQQLQTARRTKKGAAKVNNILRASVPNADVVKKKKRALPLHELAFGKYSRGGDAMG